jgi:hypothetical protein
MIERVLERGLQAELIGHLGYAKHEPAGGGNARNGTTPKTVATGSGTCRWRCRGTGRVVRAAAGAQGQRRASGWTMIISLYAGGMTVGDIRACCSAIRFSCTGSARPGRRSAGPAERSGPAASHWSSAARRSARGDPHATRPLTAAPRDSNTVKPPPQATGATGTSRPCTRHVAVHP